MRRSVRELAAGFGCLLVFSSFAVPAGAELVGAWEPPAEGAADMFRQGDRIFAVGAESGGAGAAAEPVEPELLMPSPGGTPQPNSRCAMQTGTCTGTCVAHLNYYCKPDDCSGFKFCG